MSMLSHSYQRETVPRCPLRANVMLRWTTMKTIQPLVIFLLGTAAGLCLVLLVMLSQRRADSPTPVVQALPDQAALTPPPARKSTSRRRRARGRARSSRQSRTQRLETAAVRMPTHPRRHRARTHSVTSSGATVLARNRRATPLPEVESAPTVAQSAPAPQAQPVPTVFKSIGYAEKSDGQLVAFIMQDDHVQIVRVGDRISDRYRVTSITQETVNAVEDSSVQVATSKPIPAERSTVSEVLVARAAGESTSTKLAEHATAELRISSLQGSIEHANNSMGYIEKHDVVVGVVGPEKDSVRFVSARSAERVARPIPFVRHREAKPPVSVASSVLDNSAVHSGAPLHAAIFRQVIYEDSPADDEAVSSQSAISPSHERNP